MCFQFWEYNVQYNKRLRFCREIAAMQRCIALEEDRTLLLWLMIAVYEHSWVACARLLVSAGEQRKSALAKKGGKKKRGEELLLPCFSPGCCPFFSVRFLHYPGPLYFLLVMTGLSKPNWTWLRLRRWTRIWQVHLINQPWNWRRITYFHVILLGYKFACIFCTLYRIVKVLHNMISFWLPQMKRPVSCLAATPQCTCMSWMPTMKLLSLILQATMSPFLRETRQAKIS